MGAGASSSDVGPEILMEIVKQQDKPLDASDIEDLESAKSEIRALREMISRVDVAQMNQQNATEVEADCGDTSTPPTNTVDVFRGQAIVNILRQRMEERYTSLREVFLKIDTDRSGYISKEEFQEKCLQWGICLSDEDFDNINATYQHQESPLENDHGINYNEFINLMTHSMNYKPGEGETDPLGQKLDDILRGKILDGFDTMKQAFQEVDKDHSGTVERGELDKLFDKFHVFHSQHDLDQLFKEYDKNGDGVFTYSEFVKLLNKAGSRQA